MAEPAELMEGAQQPTSSVDKIRLDSNDGQAFIVSRKAAELSKTIKTMLADLDGKSFPHVCCFILLVFLDILN